MPSLAWMYKLHCERYTCQKGDSHSSSTKKKKASTCFLFIYIYFRSCIEVKFPKSVAPGKMGCRWKTSVWVDWSGIGQWGPSRRGEKAKGAWLSWALCLSPASPPIHSQTFARVTALAFTCSEARSQTAWDYFASDMPLSCPPLTAPSRGGIVS